MITLVCLQIFSINAHRFLSTLSMHHESTIYQWRTYGAYRWPFNIDPTGRQKRFNSFSLREMTSLMLTYENWLSVRFSMSKHKSMFECVTEWILKLHRQQMHTRWLYTQRDAFVCLVSFRKIKNGSPCVCWTWQSPIASWEVVPWCTRNESFTSSAHENIVESSRESSLASTTTRWHKK